MLILSAYVKREAPRFIEGRKPGDIVEALRIWSAIIIHDAAAEVKAVAYRRSGDSHPTGIDGLDAIDGAQIGCPIEPIASQLPTQRFINSDGLVIIAAQYIA